MNRAAIFDIGGVLALDVWENLFLDEANGLAARFGIDRAEIEEAGKQLWERFAYVPETKKRGYQELETEYWTLFLAHFGKSLPDGTGIQDFVSMTDGFIAEVPGMIPVLEGLRRQGVALALCSNNTEFWFKRQRDKLAFFRFFDKDKMILSSRIGYPKSSPNFEMFKAATNALGVPPGECVFIDDRRDNIQRAQQYGMHAVVFSGVEDLRLHLSGLFPA